MTETVFRKFPSVSAQYASMHKPMHQYINSMCRHMNCMRRCIQLKFWHFSFFVQYASMHNTYVSMHSFKFCPMSRCMTLCIDASFSHTSGFLNFCCLHRHIASCVDPYCYFSPKNQRCG